MVDLAKTIHPAHVPNMEYLGVVPDFSVSVWKMDKISGVGFAEMVHDDDIKIKLPTTVEDMAKFFAAAWQCPQHPTEEARQIALEEIKVNLSQLANASSAELQPHIRQTRDALDDIMLHLPWVLTHSDLSNMNILLNPKTGRLQGVIDWAEAAILPFGIGVWGLESILGYSNSHGWTWLDSDDEQCRALFFSTFQKEVGTLSAQECDMIEKARILGLLLRYGFVWRDGSMWPTTNTTMLERFLNRKCD